MAAPVNKKFLRKFRRGNLRLAFKKVYCLMELFSIMVFPIIYIHINQ